MSRAMGIGWLRGRVRVGFIAASYGDVEVQPSWNVLPTDEVQAIFKRRGIKMTTEDDQRIVMEIDRLALQTTDPLAMQLFVEKEKLSKQLKTWKIGAAVAAAVVGLIAFVAVIPAGSWAFLGSCAVALAAYWVLVIVGGKRLGSQFENWLARARKLVG